MITLNGWLHKIKEKNILIVGDVMLDVYEIGEVSRISAEAPVPIFRKQGDRSVLGGAANVAANLAASGQKVHLLSIVGADVIGEQIIDMLCKMSIDTSLVRKINRNTTVKKRFIANGNQQIMRSDNETTDAIDESLCQSFLQCLTQQISRFDLIILSDYMKGLCSETFVQGLIALANKNDIKVLIDVKDSRVIKYSGAFLLKPNLKELMLLTGMSVETDEQIVQASYKLREMCDCSYVLTTCGSRGMILVGQDGSLFIDGIHRDVYDVTGAGDTAIAYLAAAYANGISIEISAQIANLASSLQVTKVGTAVISIEEVKDVAKMDSKQGLSKIVDLSLAECLRSFYKNKKIVFTNGCFDILHVGHVRYLQQSAQLGDVFVIGVNSDMSVKRLKGEGHPVNPQDERAEILSALQFVDYVMIFEEDTPYNLIKKLQPDVITKGGDYRPEEVIGREFVEARGGRLVLLPYTVGKSTTEIMYKLKRIKGKI